MIALTDHIVMCYFIPLHYAIKVSCEKCEILYISHKSQNRLSVFGLHDAISYPSICLEVFLVFEGTNLHQRV